MVFEFFGKGCARHRTVQARVKLKRKIDSDKKQEGKAEAFPS
mgnify:CR=1 FL=1